MLTRHAEIKLYKQDGDFVAAAATYTFSRGAITYEVEKHVVRGEVAHDAGRDEVLFALDNKAREEYRRWFVTEFVKVNQPETIAVAEEVIDP